MQHDMLAPYSIPQGPIDKASAIDDDQTTSQSVVKLRRLQNVFRKKRNQSDSELERMRIDSSCRCDYNVEYKAFLTSLRELTATPATTLKVVLDHMRRTNRPTNLLEQSMHQRKSLDIEHIHSFYRAML